MARISLLILSFVVAGALADLRRVCYYTNWAQYRNGPAKFYPENVDPSLCTHVIYAFAKMSGNKLAAFEWNDESTPWMKGMYERFAEIKNTNPSVKLLLAVGGWNMGSAPFTSMVASDGGRTEFAQTTVTFLRTNGFDGLDLDWEYPANRGSPAGDKHKFTLLIQKLREVFDAETPPAGKDKLMISAAVAAGKDKIDTAYEIPEISKLLDMINLMSYDLHGSWEDHTGHNSPLFARSSETGNDSTLNVDWAAQYWVQKGAPKSKLNIGMGMYGRSFKLSYGQSDVKIGCAASGAGTAGLYTREGGFLSYYEICEMIKNGGTKYYEQEQKVPYIVSGDQWVGYDDADSLRLKVDYVVQEGFGGVMVWALDLDDFSGMCGEGKYPLLHAINDELTKVSTPGSPGQPTTTQPTTTQPTTQPPTTQPPTTQPAATNPPATNPPATNPPATNPPATNPPATNPPATNPPATNPPTTTSGAPAATTTVSHGSGSGHHELTPVNSAEFDCSGKSDGYYASPTDCSSYYICAASMAFRTDCHPGLMFNTDTLYCDFPDHVNCQASSSSSSSTGGQATQPQPIVTQPPTPPPTTTKATTTRATTTRAPATTTTMSSSGGNPADFCVGKSDGFYKDPQDCSYFYQCNFEISYHEPCPAGTYFSVSLQGCDWAANVPSCP